MELFVMKVETTDGSRYIVVEVNDVGNLCVLQRFNADEHVMALAWAEYHEVRR